MKVDPVRAILIADSPVNTLVSGRIYPLRVPQGRGFPAIALNVITGKGEDTKSGVSTTDTGLIQVSVFSESYDTAIDISEKARLALDKFSGTVGSVVVDSIVFDTEREVFEDESKLVFHKSADYRVRFKR